MEQFAAFCVSTHKETEKIDIRTEETDMLEVGTDAPDFTLPDQNGTPHSLSQYRGQKVILYFYPKDMTGGCTKQACGFAERYPQF